MQISDEQTERLPDCSATVLITSQQLYLMVLHKSSMLESCFTVNFGEEDQPNISTVSKAEGVAGALGF